jgi:ubiquinone biosynthesis protein UbiJ
MMREKKRDFAAEIDDIEQSLEHLKTEVTRLLESNSALPG